MDVQLAPAQRPSLPSSGAPGHWWIPERPLTSPAGPRVCASSAAFGACHLSVALPPPLVPQSLGPQAAEGLADLGTVTQVQPLSHRAQR